MSTHDYYKIAAMDKPGAYYQPSPGCLTQNTLAFITVEIINLSHTKKAKGNSLCTNKDLIS